MPAASRPSRYHKGANLWVVMELVERESSHLEEPRVKVHRGKICHHFDISQRARNVLSEDVYAALWRESFPKLRPARAHETVRSRSTRKHVRTGRIGERECLFRLKVARHSLSMSPPFRDDAARGRVHLAPTHARSFGSSGGLGCQHRERAVRRVREVLRLRFVGGVPARVIASRVVAGPRRS
jgi:hypothetical protein